MRRVKQPVLPALLIVVSFCSLCLSGNLTRRTLLWVVIPLMFVSYFGMLSLAIALSPGTYDWCSMSISRLLYPRANPTFHFVASGGFVATGLLMIPFVGYIHRRLRVACPVASRVGAAVFASGIIFLILTALISSHPLHARSTVPKLHDILAHIAGLGLGAGLAVFNACGVKGCFNPGAGKRIYKSSLIVGWNLITVPSILIVIVMLGMRARFHWLDPIYQTLQSSVVWHLGFWEWIGSSAVFLFLACSAAFLPEHAGE
jgi:hypothetical protein